MEVLKIAKVCYEVNKAYCKAIGDNSQPKWEDAQEWQKEPDVSGAIYNIKNPEAPPSFAHDKWMDDKIKAGWKYGAKKDSEKKEHPCIVDYSELPVEQKAKDYIFQAIVRELKNL